MSYIIDIKNEILKLDGGSFQNLCDEYLNECGYKNIVALGSKSGTHKTTLGTPDTYCCVDSNDKYIFIEYTTQQTRIYEKITSDLKKCLDEENTHISCKKIAEILYFHTTSIITPEQDLGLKDLCKTKGILLKIYGIDYLANELYNNHKSLVKQHLGISIDTEQILSYNDFIISYNRAKTAAPIDTDFKFRTNDVNSVISALNDNKVVLLYGEAGVGKTRLALECCCQYAQKNNYEIFCIKNNNLEIYDDLHLFFKPSGKYMLLIDDANELTKLDTILKYFTEINEIEHRIIMTVRNYAAKSIITTVKPIVEITTQSISILKDEEIEELIKDKYGIVNQSYLERIVKIAEGNARIAFLAGKIVVDYKSLAAIKDVTDLYSTYYGKYLSKIDEKDRKMFLAAAVTAFVGAIHLEHLDEISIIISLCNMTKEDFRNAIIQLHEEEIINIYKEKAVRFADQCLSNYLLYYVFIKEKWIKLSEIIRYTFKYNKEQTISSINILTNLFINEDNQEYLFSEIKALWDELSKEDPVFFWEYVKVFYRVDPTDALLLIKKQIDSTTPVNIPVENLKIKENTNSVTDDILAIIGGFANTEYLLTALDLYFIYFQKRPDLINQFYFTAINNYGVDKESYKYDFYSSKMFIEKIVQESDNWENKYICKLFVYIAKYFLKLHFNGTESGRKYSIIWYQFDLINSDSIEEYRRMIWNSLAELYAKNIETDFIENIVAEYGRDYGEKSKEIIENDQQFIIELLDIFNNKTDYYFCKIINNLQQVFNNVEIIHNSKLNLYTNSDQFKLFESFGSIIDYSLKHVERVEKLKESVESTIAPINKEIFISIIDFFCNSNCKLTYNNNIALNYAFEYVIKNKDYYFDVLEYYLKNQFHNDPLNPYDQIRLMFERFSDNEIWSMISIASDEIRNTWQYCYFALLPDNFIDVDHLQKWYAYLKNDSDRYISTSMFRSILFLKKYICYDPEVIINSYKIILSEKQYSKFIINIYLEPLLSPLAEEFDERIELFKGHYDLLSRLYIEQLSNDRQTDYHGTFLKAIYEKYPIILDLLFEKWEKSDSFITHDDTIKLSKLFELENYEKIYDYIIDKVITIRRGTLLFQEDELNSIVALANIEEQYKDRPKKWIRHSIEEYYDDMKKIDLISKAILCFSEEDRIEFIKLFLSYNKYIDSFKNFKLFSSSMSWSGSEVPLIQERIDYLSRIAHILTGLDFLEHRKYIEESIESEKRYMANVEIDEIIRGL